MKRPNKTVAVYVYGTLRPGGTETVQVPGILYDLGWYPGAILKSPEGGSFFTCEKIYVSERKLEELDAYEGCRPGDPAHSLYLRVPYLDGFIYTYNHPLTGRKVIESGDWLKHYDGRRGRAYYDLIHGGSEAKAKPEKVVENEEVSECQEVSSLIDEKEEAA